MSFAHETDRIVGMLDAAEAGTLVLFDIDNTLVRPRSPLGSDEWLFYLEAYFRKTGTAEAEVSKKAEVVWNEAQWLNETEAVDPEVPAKIRELQSRGIAVMGLTARIVEASPVTEHQLSRIGVDLSVLAVSNDDLVIDQSVFGTADIPVYRNGILYIGETNVKGAVLARFLETEGSALKPRAILFFDDKEKHLRSVEAACAGLSIERFAGARYSKTDPQVRAFNVLAEAALAFLLADRERFAETLLSAESFRHVEIEGVDELRLLPALLPDLKDLYLHGAISPALAAIIADRQRYAARALKTSRK